MKTKATQGAGRLVLEIDKDVRASIERAVASGMDSREAAAALMNSAVLYIAGQHGADAGAALTEQILLRMWHRLDG